MELCLGTVQFGLNYGIQRNGQPEKKDCFKIMDRCFENGINTFDTAKAYGTSEKILGEYFKGKERNSFKIATKLETVVDPEKEIRESLENLGLDYVDYYLLHDGAMMNEQGLTEAVHKLKEKGLLLNAGVSVYTPEEALRAVNDPFVDCIQIPYNAIDKRLDKEGFFEKAQAYGKTVFTRSIFLQGLLLMEADKAEERLIGSGDTVRKFAELCDKNGLTRLQFASGYIRQKKGIDFCIFGVDNEKQLQEQIELQKIVITEQALKEADEIFWNVDTRILDPRKWNK